MDKSLIRYVVPNIFAMMGMSCYILADTFFISVAAGANGITALNLTLPIYGIIFALGAMIGIGSATRYSLCKAMGQRDAADYFSNSILFSVLIGLLLTVLGVFCPEWILKAMGADETILQVGTGYLRIAMCFSPFFMTNYSFTAFVRNDGAPKIAMAATLLSSLFNIVFDYVFMFPLQMGMIGAALATAVSPIVSMLICLVHYLSADNTITFRFLIPSWSKLISSCKLGIVAFVGELSSGITTLVFNYLLLNLGGNIAVAAYGVVANLAIVGTSIFNGVSQGLQPLASEAHGKQEHQREKKIYRQSLQIGLVLAAAVVVLVWLLAEPITALFNSENSAEMAAYAVPGLRLYFVGFLAASVNVIRSGFFSATGNGVASAVIAILRGIVAISIFALILSRFWGMTGIWLSFLAAELFTLLVTGGCRLRSLSQNRHESL